MESIERYTGSDACYRMIATPPSKQRDIAGMDSSPSPAAPKASFLDLPGELRNEIYSQNLRCETEQRLKFKQKTSPNGIGYIQERAPTLCHALPLLRGEIMSTYYASNNFRVGLTTPRRRDLFIKWVEERGSLLKDLTRLKIGFKIQREACKRGKRRVHQVSSNLQIAMDTNGGLQVVQYYARDPHCRLCTASSMYRVEVQELPRVTVAESLATGPLIDGQLVNLVVALALGICRTLEAVYKGETELKMVHWLERASGADECRCCGVNVRKSLL